VEEFAPDTNEVKIKYLGEFAAAFSKLIPLAFPVLLNTNVITSLI